MLHGPSRARIYHRPYKRISTSQNVHETQTLRVTKPVAVEADKSRVETIAALRKGYGVASLRPEEIAGHSHSFLIHTRTLFHKRRSAAAFTEDILRLINKTCSRRQARRDENESAAGLNSSKISTSETSLMIAYNRWRRKIMIWASFCAEGPPKRMTSQDSSTLQIFTLLRARLVNCFCFIVTIFFKTDYRGAFCQRWGSSGFKFFISRTGKVGLAGEVECR